MSRSVTVPVPTASGVARTILLVVLGLVILAVGVRLGIGLFSPGPAAEFGRDDTLQEIVTTGNTFVGQVVGDDGTYLRLRGPAIVRDAGGGSGQLIVQLLTADPFDLDGDILIPRSQVVVLGNVTTGSGLETAYRQATGELPQPTPGPTPAPTST